MALDLYNKPADGGSDDISQWLDVADDVAQRGPRSKCLMHQSKCLLFEPPIVLMVTLHMENP